MRITGLLAIIALFFSCSIFSPQNPQTSNKFTLKFINVGTYPITGFYLNAGNDSINWGQNILPVASLSNNEYVLMGNLEKGPEYAFRAKFDSSGTTAYLIHTYMPSGPDTISAHAGLDTNGSWGIGHQWGLQIWPGEHLVGQ
jgi:hypothetical protein